MKCRSGHLMGPCDPICLECYAPEIDRFRRAILFGEGMPTVQRLALPPDGSDPEQFWPWESEGWRPRDDREFREWMEGRDG